MILLYLKSNSCDTENSESSLADESIEEYCNLDNDRHFSKRDYHHLRILGAPPVSSEGEDSPIIWPISKTNDTTKITNNNNLD